MWWTWTKPANLGYWANGAKRAWACGSYIKPWSLNSQEPALCVWHSQSSLLISVLIQFYGFCKDNFYTNFIITLKLKLQVNWSGQRKTDLEKKSSEGILMTMIKWTLLGFWEVEGWRLFWEMHKWGWVSSPWSQRLFYRSVATLASALL